MAEAQRLEVRDQRRRVVEAELLAELEPVGGAWQGGRCRSIFQSPPPHASVPTLVAQRDQDAFGVRMLEQLADGAGQAALPVRVFLARAGEVRLFLEVERSEEHTSELQSLMRISYAVFCLKKKKRHNNNRSTVSA